MSACDVEASGKSPSPTAGVTASPRSTSTPTPKPTATPSSTPSASVSLPAPGTLPAGGTRKNPLPPSPKAPALITVDPSTIDPRVENTLNLFGRNLSAETRVQIDSTPVSITYVLDAWHLLVRVPGGVLTDGDHDLVLTNPDGQFDRAVGALSVRTPGPPRPLYWIGGALIIAFALYRLYRRLTAH